MGFGLLLMGYFAVNMIAIYPPLSAAMLIGYGLMVFALFRLAPYHKLFYQCRNFSFLALPFAVYYAVYGLTTIHVLPEMALFTSALDTAVDWAYFAYTLLLQLLLLYAVFQLSHELEIVKLQAGALRNMIFVAIYHLFYLFAKLPFAFIQNNVGLLSLPIAILRLVCVFCNLWLFYCCYRTILPEGSDTTPQLPNLMGSVRNKEK